MAGPKHMGLLTARTQRDVVTSSALITTARLSLVALEARMLSLMATRGQPRPFEWPVWWPDDEDLGHLACGWGPTLRTLEAHEPSLDTRNRMVGHVGFHQRPRAIEEALAHPTFNGTRELASEATLEIGYTIFSEYRGLGYATEAVSGLLDWAWPEGVTSVLACVTQDNALSFRVLDSVGGFSAIGRCKSDDGVIEVVLRRDQRDLAFWHPAGVLGHKPV